MWSADRMLDDLDDSHLALEPVAGNKSAGWLLGHLCITGDFGLRLCGATPIGPKEWRTLFGPGTKSSDIPASAYPRMTDLVTTFRAIYKELPAAAAAAQSSVLDMPNPFEPARPAFPTVRDFIPWLMSGHLGYHLGQLGDWRRAAGLGHKGHI
jgi:hypothetical protein